MFCSRCQQINDRVPQRYCRACHNAYAKEWRKRNPLTPLQRMKDIARSYALVYLKRGKLTRKPCEDCGATKAEMHHEDYSKPTEVIWLCRACHLLRHKYEQLSGIRRLTEKLKH